jgi:hypothetical protein
MWRACTLRPTGWRRRSDEVLAVENGENNRELDRRGHDAKDERSAKPASASVVYEMTAAIAVLPLTAAGTSSTRFSCQMIRPSADTAFIQRLILAFTTGLFLSCAARVSAASAAVVNPSTAATSAR